MLAVMTDSDQHHHEIPAGFWLWEAHDGEEGEKKNPILALHSSQFLSPIPTFRIPSLTHGNAELGEHGDLGGLGGPRAKKKGGWG